MRGRLALLVLAFSVAAGMGRAETELVLRDGRVISAIAVRVEGDDYVVTLEGDHSLVIPRPLVELTRLTGTGTAPRAAEPAEPAELGAAPPAGPSGIVRDAPRSLAGPESRPPTTSEQLRVLGKPAQFQDDIVDHDWQPTTDWDMDPERQNNFAPSTWSAGVVDPTWHPESAFDQGRDVLAGGRATWQPGVIDSSWTPQDGFAK